MIVSASSSSAAAAVVVLACCSMSLMVDAGNFTVTDEAWFNVVVENLHGPGRNFTGKFVVALFGETVPMTVMNFVAITRGYERVNQVRHDTVHVHLTHRYHAFVKSSRCATNVKVYSHRMRCVALRCYAAPRSNATQCIQRRIRCEYVDVRCLPCGAALHRILPCE